MESLKRRKLTERFFYGLMLCATASLVVSLLLILGSIIYRGLPALSWDMVLKAPKGGFYMGKDGGVLNAILGSIYLAFGATLLAFIAGLPIALYINIFRRRKSRFASGVRTCLDVLWGVPSIVYGAFGFTIMIFFGIKASLFMGTVIVALLVLPVIVRSIDEVICLVPNGLLEASYSLGATKTQTALRIVVKQILPGIVTALLVAFGRAIGDAAAVLFTAGYTDRIPKSPFRAVATLPLAVFFQLSSPIPEVQQRAYASALILTIIILVVSIVARVVSRRVSKYKI